MRRLFGPRARTARQDVLLMADLAAISEEGDFAAGAAYRKAKKEKGREMGSEDRGKTGISK